MFNRKISFDPITPLFLYYVLQMLSGVLAFPGLGLSAAHNRLREGRDLSMHAPLQKRAAAPFNPTFPYTNARYDGLPGDGKGGILVPDIRDTAHRFRPPGPNDIRGPCPGMNTAANHNFISHDGITTYSEMVAASQNIYNMGWDLAVVLAVLAVVEDGDIITEKCSIGHEATSATAFLGGIFGGTEGGYNDHNKFEADTSLTRNDFFLAPDRDNFRMNGSLFSQFRDTANEVSHGLFNRDTLLAYQAERYRQSLADNGQFFYGPKAVILLGAATFVYQLFPSGGITGIPDLPVTESFFGAVSDDSVSGGFRYVPEKIPSFWRNTPKPYGLLDVVAEVAIFLERNPEENVFGGNVGRGNFIPLNFGAIKNGRLGGGSPPTINDVACLIYQILTDNTPSGLDDILDKPIEILEWAAGKVNGIFGGFGCDLR